MIDMARVLSDVGEMRRQILAFHIECEEAEHTDTGSAWELLDNMRERLESLLIDAGVRER